MAENNRVFVLKDLSAGVRASVNQIKRPLSSFADQLRIVKEGSSTLAPKVMSLYDKIKREIGAKLGASVDEAATVGDEAMGGFVGFTRILDPTVPKRADDKDGEIGYRNHPMYYACAYLKRQYSTGIGRKNRDANQGQGKANYAKDREARIVASLIAANVITLDTYESALRDEWKIAPRMIKRLIARVKAVDPVFKVEGAKPPRSVEIFHMEGAASGNKLAADAPPVADNVVMPAARRAVGRRGGRRAVAVGRRAAA